MTVFLFSYGLMVYLRSTLFSFFFYLVKVVFNQQGTRILTASSDHTARLWDPITGECLQVSYINFIKVPAKA